MTTDTDARGAGDVPLPCPFCGGTFYNRGVWGTGHRADCYILMPPRALIETESEIAKHQAKLDAAWNRRAADPRAAPSFRSDVEAMQRVLGFGKTWSARSCLVTLLAAVDHMFTVHNCDSHGHEEWQTARNEAAERIKEMDTMLTEAQKEDPRAAAGALPNVSCMKCWDSGWIRYGGSFGGPEHRRRCPFCDGKKTPTKAERPDARGECANPQCEAGQIVAEVRDGSDMRYEDCPDCAGGGE